MTDTLTPPADAPLPWTVLDSDPLAPAGGYVLPDVLDANGIEIACVGTEDNAIVGIDRRREAHASIARYLVAAANAYPGLVAERDAAVALATIEHGTAETLRRDVEAFKRDRDRAVMALDTDALHVYTARLARDEARQDRDAALARVAALSELVRDIAEVDCSFDDDCPPLQSRHPSCGPCRARQLLAALETP